MDLESLSDCGDGHIVCVPEKNDLTKIGLEPIDGAAQLLYVLLRNDGILRQWRGIRHIGRVLEWGVGLAAAQNIDGGMAGIDTQEGFIPVVMLPIGGGLLRRIHIRLGELIDMAEHTDYGIGYGVLGIGIAVQDPERHGVHFLAVPRIEQRGKVCGMQSRHSRSFRELSISYTSGKRKCSHTNRKIRKTRILRRTRILRILLENSTCIVPSRLAFPPDPCYNRGRGSHTGKTRGSGHGRPGGADTTERGTVGFYHKGES